MSLNAARQLIYYRTSLLRSAVRGGVPAWVAALAADGYYPDIAFDFDSGTAFTSDYYSFWPLADGKPPGVFFDFNSQLGYTGDGTLSGTISSIASLLTCTRASTAYGRDSTGIYQSFANNTLRYDYRTVGGTRRLLVEEARTNRVFGSAGPQIGVFLTVTGGSGTFTDGETVTAGGGGSGTYIAAYSTSTQFALVCSTASGFTGTLTGGTSGATKTISATTTAWSNGGAGATPAHTTQQGPIDYMGLITEDTSTGQHRRRQVVSGFTAGATVSATVYVKANGRTLGNFRLMDSASTANTISVNFDTSGVTATPVATGAGSATSAAIEATAISGVYKVTLIGIPNPGYTSLNVDILLRDAGGSTSYTGDGASGIYCSDIQVEEGAFVTSPIRTTSAAATRAADVVTMTLPTALQLPGVSAYTLYAKWFDPGNSTFRIPAAIAGSSSAERISIQVTGSNAAHGQVVSGGSDTYGDTPTAITSASHALAVAAQSDDARAALDGTLLAVDSLVTMPSNVTTLYAGGVAGGSFLNGGVEKIAIWASRRTDSDLQGLTT